MSNDIFIKRLVRLNKLISKWGTADQNPRASNNLTKEIINQYLATKRAQFEGHLDWDDGQIRTYNSAEFDAILNLVTLAPIIELAKKGQKYLENNEIEKLREILDELQNEKKLTSKIKSAIGKSDRKEHPINQLIANELKNNPTIKLPQLKANLKRMEGKGVIILWDDEENEIISQYPNGKNAIDVSITGLKDRFYDVQVKK